MFSDFSLLSYLLKAEKNIFINGAVVLFYIVRKKKYIYIYIFFFFSMSSLVLFCFPFACYCNEKIDRKRWEDIDDSHLRGTDLVAHWNNSYFSFLCSPHVSKLFFSFCYGIILLHLVLSNSDLFIFFFISPSLVPFLLSFDNIVQFLTWYKWYWSIFLFLSINTVYISFRYH